MSIKTNFQAPSTNEAPIYNALMFENLVIDISLKIVN